MPYRILLFDCDNTILDFNTAERNAIARTFAEFGIPCSDGILEVYHRHNIKHWELLEKKIETRRECLENRFAETFLEIGAKGDPVKVNRSYEIYLSQGHWFMPGAERITTPSAAADAIDRERSRTAITRDRNRFIVVSSLLLGFASDAKFGKARFLRRRPRFCVHRHQSALDRSLIRSKPPIPHWEQVLFADIIGNFVTVNGDFHAKRLFAAYNSIGKGTAKGIPFRIHGFNYKIFFTVYRLDSFVPVSPTDPPNAHALCANGTASRHQRKSKSNASIFFMTESSIH